MKLIQGLAVSAALVLLLLGFTALPLDACDGGCGCSGKSDGGQKCGDSCKCGGKCGDGCKCGGKCGDGCKCGGKCGAKGDDASDIRYSDPVFFGFEVQRLSNGLPVVTWMDEEGRAGTIGFKHGDILLSVNGREVSKLSSFLKAIDDRKVPAALRIVRSGKVIRLIAPRAGCDFPGQCGGKGGCKVPGQCGGKGGCEVPGQCKGKGAGKCGPDCGGKCGEGCKGKCQGKCDGTCASGCTGKGTGKAAAKAAKSKSTCVCGGSCGGDCGDDCKCKARNKAIFGVLLGVAQATGADGAAKLTSVEEGKAGSGMGLKADDVILSVNGVDVDSKRRLMPEIKVADGTLSLLILRGRSVLRICAGVCDNRQCDGCNGRTAGKTRGCGGG
ncbi:MAG: PDZ domain-containing protein [Planctomycetota bacterium]